MAKFEVGDSFIPTNKSYLHGHAGGMSWTVTDVTEGEYFYTKSGTARKPISVPHHIIDNYYKLLKKNSYSKFWRDLLKGIK